MAIETALLFFGSVFPRMNVFNFANDIIRANMLKTAKKIFCAQFHHILSRSASSATRTTDRSSMKTKDDCTVPKESRENLLQPDLLQMTTGSVGNNRVKLCRK
jgi:hypothetical protein